MLQFKDKSLCIVFSLDFLHFHMSYFPFYYALGPKATLLYDMIHFHNNIAKHIHGGGGLNKATVFLAYYVVWPAWPHQDITIIFVEKFYPIFMQITYS